MKHSSLHSLLHQGATEPCVKLSTEAKNLGQEFIQSNYLMNNCSPNKLQYKEPESPPPPVPYYFSHTWPFSSKSCHFSICSLTELPAWPTSLHSRHDEWGTLWGGGRTDRRRVIQILSVCASLFVFISHSDSTTRKQAERLKRFPQKPPNKNMSASVKNKS